MEKIITENKEIADVIKKTVEELVNNMGFASSVEIKKEDESNEETLVCNIKTEYSQFLIGQYGVNLQALQHLARLVVRRRTEERANFILDVNSYRQEKNESLEKMAKEMADQSIRERRSITLRPMSAYERRIVHMELAKNSQIKTESIGERENRKVVIKPAELV